MLGVGGYIVLYRFLTPEAFGERLQSSLIRFRPENVPGLLVEQFHSALQRVPLLFGAAILGIMAAMRRRTPLDRLLVIVLLSSALIFAGSYPYYRDYYLVHSLVPLMLLAGGAFYELEKALAAEQRRTILTGTMIFVSAACLGVLVQRIQADGTQRYNEALEVARRMRDTVPVQEVFVGVDPFYFEMYDYPSFVELNTAGWVAIQAGIDEREAWEQIGPTSVAIVNAYPMPPPEALLDYIAAHDLRPVRCWSTDKLGEVVLYMQTIPDGVTASDDCEMVS
jgi:hypothetical protein